MDPRERPPKPKSRDNEDPRPDDYRPAEDRDQRINEKAEQEAFEEAHPATQGESSIEGSKPRPDDGTE